MSAREFLGKSEQSESMLLTTKLRIEALAMILGLCLGLWGMREYSNQFVVKLDEAGFTDGTTTVVSTRHDLHFHMTDPSHLGAVGNWINEHEGKKVALWLGNSQLHAINKYHEGR